VIPAINIANWIVANSENAWRDEKVVESLIIGQINAHLGGAEAGGQGK
jgi:hypothetical protein